MPFDFETIRRIRALWVGEVVGCFGAFFGAVIGNWFDGSVGLWWGGVIGFALGVILGVVICRRIG